MGYAVYWSNNQQRYCGYGVPAYCDHPKCNEKINRGMGYVCGEPLQDQFGCGGYFCSKHRNHVRQPRGEDQCFENCQRCGTYKRSYKFTKSEHPEWVEHLLKDASWRDWRKENPAQVSCLKKYGMHYEPHPKAPTNGRTE